MRPTRKPQITVSAPTAYIDSAFTEQRVLLSLDCCDNFLYQLIALSDDVVLRDPDLRNRRCEEAKHTILRQARRVRDELNNTDLEGVE